MIIDSHAHLNDEALIKDAKDIINRANEFGVSTIFVPGWNVESSTDAITLSKEFENVYALVGIHPENIDGLILDDVKKIEDLAKYDKVIAIGEIGLDYHYTKENKEMQIEFLKKQLELAYKLNLPVSIHERDATGDFMEVIREFFKTHEIKEGFGVMHSFASSKEILKELLKYGFYFSYSGPVTFKNAVNQKESALHCPIDKILVETDSPYLSPTPLRGTKNEPKNVKYVLEEIARIKNIDSKELEEMIYNNTRRLFKI